MKKFVLIISFVLLAAIYCQGEKYASIKELVESNSIYDKFWTTGKFAGVHNMKDLIFFIEDADYKIPVKLLKRDLNAEKRFKSMNLKIGDRISVRGRLKTIMIEWNHYSGLDEASFIDRKSEL